MLSENAAQQAIPRTVQTIPKQGEDEQAEDRDNIVSRGTPPHQTQPVIVPELTIRGRPARQRGPGTTTEEPRSGRSPGPCGEFPFFPWRDLGRPACHLLESPFRAAAGVARRR